MFAKKRIYGDIRVINDKLYNVKGIKKLKEFDIADEVVTDSSDIDFIGGRYTVYANKQIIRTYIANGKVIKEEVDKIPESRSNGNAKRILDGEIVSKAENIILEFSGIYDGYRAVTGKDPETGKKINGTDQALAAISIIPVMKLLKVGKYAFKIDQGKNVARKVDKPAKGAGKEYRNYKAVEYNGNTKINGEVRDTSRRVFQRIDIDYKRFGPKTGKTNYQLMKSGRPPIWKDGTKIELHHLIQREPGSMVELPSSMHKEYDRILHGLVENGGSFRNDPVLKKQYENFRSKYWRWRAKQIDKSEL
ncbi:Ribonuclease YobL [Bacillus pumilus]|nr:Ribonuclease YobL [Bacillus pumilus]